MKKEAVGIGTQTTSKNGDRKIMQPIRIEDWEDTDIHKEWELMEQIQLNIFQNNTYKWGQAQGRSTT